MDIKGRTKGKQIKIIGILLGICVAVVSLFYFFHTEKAEAEERMVEIVNYVKVQCSTYTHYNESSESKSLLRAIESARQMSTNIKMEIENGGQLSRDFLKENLQTLWVDGIIVLDAEGKTDCEYSTDESLANEITEYLQKEIIMNFAGYEERSYSERFTREDGSFIDIAACARKDALGIVAIYYYTSPEFARNYTLTIQGLLNGYSVQKDGTIIVADNGIVVASNDESLLGQNTADNEVVQAMKKHSTVILLTAKPETILKRVQHNQSRPVLNGKKNIDDITKLMKEREERYHMTADILISTDGKSLSQICEEIADMITK